MRNRRMLKLTTAYHKKDDARIHAASHFFGPPITITHTPDRRYLRDERNLDDQLGCDAPQET
jgi:hypothetical protein